MNPFEYQKKLVEEYKPKNEENIDKYFESFNKGHHIVMVATVNGAYMNHVTYWFSDGTQVVIAEAASLSWVPYDIY